MGNKRDRQWSRAPGLTVVYDGHQRLSTAHALAAGHDSLRRANYAYPGAQFRSMEPWFGSVIIWRRYMPWWAKWHGETLDMASIKRDIIAARVSRFIPANLLHRVAWYAMPLRNATTGLFAGLRITWVYWPKVIDERIYRESKSPKAFRNRRLA